jgi:hypothetical protein
MISNKSNKENYKDIREKVLKHLLKQVDNDKALDTLKPDIDWPKRVKETISKFVPSLIERASWLKAEIERVLNSSKRTREQWEQIKDQLARQELPSKVKKIIAQMDTSVNDEELLTRIDGSTVSRVISKSLLMIRDDIVENGGNTYPDLYFCTADYSLLPKRTKSNPKGPAVFIQKVKGKKKSKNEKNEEKRRPTCVPDGLEIKSCKGIIKADCHAPHQGTQVVVLYGSENGKWFVHDICIGYLSESNYKHRERNSPTATDKWSFQAAPFISVLTGQSRSVELIDRKDSEANGIEEKQTGLVSCDN